MEEKKKKVIFTEAERLLLKQCVLASRVLTSNKQTDKVSNLEKAKAWDEVTRYFNYQAKNIPRTVNQLKKLWENIKFRRKAELANAKRNLITIGGGPYTPSQFVEDPELDPLRGIDMESIDSDPLATGSYVVTPQGSLTQTLEVKPETEDFIKKEAELRVARLSNQILYDKELHALKVKEARVKLELAEAELEVVKLKKEMLLKDLNKNLIFQ